MTINVERLRRPEHEDREEVGSRDERNNKCQPKNPGLLTKSLGEHGMFGSVSFPEDKGDEESDTQDQGREHVCAGPLVLVATPLHAHHEQDHTSNRQETADVVDLRENLSAAHTHAVDAGRRVVEHEGQDETDESPET